MSKLIHKTAIIHPNAKIADNVEIGPFTVIGEDTIIESGVKIKSHAQIEFSRIGENSIIFAGAIIGTEPQDLSYKGAKTFVEVGKNCQIREYVTINRAAGEEGNKTVIGDNCLLMTGSHAGHNSFLEESVIMANDVILAGYVHVEEGAFLGGNIVVHQNCNVGKMSIMSGFSGTRQDIPPFSKTAGAPSYIAGLNTIGMKRKGMSLEDRTLIKEAYKYLFHSGLNTSQAVEKIEQELGCDNEHLNHLIKFIKASKRGIVKAH